MDMEMLYRSLDASTKMVATPYIGRTHACLLITEKGADSPWVNMLYTTLF